MWRWRSTAVVFLILVAPNAAGDGVILPEQINVQTPAIPAQRAFLSFRVGVEVLMIESTFNGEGNSFAWIIPVPATPMRMEVGSAGFLETLNVKFRPKMVVTQRKSSREFMLAQCVAVLTVLWALVVIVRRPSLLRFSFVYVTVLAVGTSFVFVHTKMRGTLGVPPEAGRVRIERTTVVGDYQVDVLQADSANALNT
jgi:hypothetical protein